ncbi:peptidylprolyl isomerase, partial [Pseudoxanthomonas sp. SGD-10]
AKELNGTLFHRVIKNFMIQGGDVESKNAEKGAFLGSGDLGYKIKAEFNSQLFHKKGALAAARDNNPEKSSSSCQFYIVQGRTFTDAELDQMEVYGMRGNKFSEKQREVYRTLGGAPHLDGEYTVFGEVVKGLDVADKIAALATDRNNRPFEDVKMELKLLKKREVKRILQ